MIDIKKLYRTGYPPIGTKLRVDGDCTLVVNAVVISKSRVMSNDHQPTVKFDIFRRGTRDGTHEMGLQDALETINGRGTFKLLELGTVEVISPLLV